MTESTVAEQFPEFVRFVCMEEGRSIRFPAAGSEEARATQAFFKERSTKSPHMRKGFPKARGALTSSWKGTGGP